MKEMGPIPRKLWPFESTPGQLVGRKNEKHVRLRLVVFQ